VLQLLQRDVFTAGA